MALPTWQYIFGAPVFLEPWDPIDSALENGAWQIPTTTRLELNDNWGNQIVFRGSFTIDNGVVTGGTVTGFSVSSGPTKLLEASGYAIAATDLINAVEAAQQDNDDSPFWDLVYNIPLVQIGTSQTDYLYGTGEDGVLIGGAGNDQIEGEVGNETIRGGKGDDFISGSEGLDTLFGDAGKDVFYFRSETDIDRVKDFEVKKDLINLDFGDFEELGPGFVSASEFTIGSSAKTADQHLIYDKSTGALYYDADGIDVAAQVQIAKLSAGLNLTAGHFFLPFYD